MTYAHPKERSRFHPLDGHHSYRLAAMLHGGEPSPSLELTSLMSTATLVDVVGVASSGNPQKRDFIGFRLR
jgi:hypothetical protein